MNAIQTMGHALKSDFGKTKRGESMNYLAAIVCVIALVTINIFGKESPDINSILSAAIMAFAWGGVQRGKKDDEPPTRRRYVKKPADESGPQ